MATALKTQFISHKNYLGFPSGSGGKESACNAEDLSSIPGSGRSPGEGIGNPFQYSSLENPMDRGSWQATVHGIAEPDTTERLNNKIRIAYGVECACVDILALRERKQLLLA